MLTLVDSLDVSGARIETKFKLRRNNCFIRRTAQRARPYVRFIFNYLNDNQYRFVCLGQKLSGKWYISLNQLGTYDGETGGRKGIKILPNFKKSKWHDLRIDLHTYGQVEAYLDDQLVLSVEFNSYGGGRVGVFTRRTIISLDDFAVFEDSLLPTAKRRR